MTNVARETSLRSTLDRVWARATDFETMPAWFLGVRHVAVLSPQMGLGAERSVTLLTGQSYRERIAEWRPNESFTYVVLRPPALFRQWKSRISLWPSSGGVVMRWEISYETRFGDLGRLIDRLVVAPFLDRVLFLSLRRFGSALAAER